MRSKIIAAIAVLTLAATAIGVQPAFAATSGRVYKATIGGVKYCLESQTTPSQIGTITSHSSTTCSTASAVGRPAGYLGVGVYGYYDPERDGTFVFCGDSGYVYSPVDNIWSFTIGPTQMCPTPAGLQNYLTYTHGQAWVPLTGYVATGGNVASPTISA
jgi:hypothetical protein